MRSCGFIAPPGPPPGQEFAEAVLWAGDIVAETAPVRMNTVLGSCVAVCLYDAALRFGGMNHYLVPRGGQAAIHGDWSIPSLVGRLESLGSSPRRLQAKVFGGGSPLRLANDELAVGAGNVAIAHEVLGHFGIPIVAERVRHTGGMRLYFENWTGTVWVHRHETGENHE